MKILNELKRVFKSRFKMKDLGQVTTYLGVDIKYEKNKIELSQEKYIEKIAKEFEVTNSNRKRTPMEKGLDIKLCEKNDSTGFQSLIGALLYISTGTRPDVSYSVGYLSRYQNYCTKEIFKYGLRILIYLYHTKSESLIFEKCNEDAIVAYVDSDWAADTNDSKSTTGFVIYGRGCPVLWRSIKQKNVSRSSTFAEYYALAECVDEVLFVKELLTFLDNRDSVLTGIIFEDNSSTKSIAEKGIHLRR